MNQVDSSGRTPPSPSIDELKEAVDVQIVAFLTDVTAELPDAVSLVAHIERLVRAGGKRLRPAFCYWGFRAGGGQHGADIIRASASLELLHTFALVHDDIMDASSERRGQPTVHVLEGMEIALLVGDLALVLADAMLTSSGFAPAEVGRAFSHYSRMRKEVIVGQNLDVGLTRRVDVDEDEARHVARLKSGRYSIREPLLIGAALATKTQVPRLESFGELLGEAFQLRDDLLGTFGDSSVTGKPNDSDIREGKRNVLYAKTLAALDGAERKFFVESWGGRDRLDAADCARLRSLVESSGARAATEDLLAELTAAALAELEEVVITEEVRAGLQDLADRATSRYS